MENLIVIGAGGYAKSVLDSVNLASYHMVGFIDERMDKKSTWGILSWPIRWKHCQTRNNIRISLLSGTMKSERDGTNA